MKTITIHFKGDLEIGKKDIVVYGEDGLQVNTSKLSVPTIIARIKNGTYKLNFFETYKNAFDGTEEYEFEESED